jgi:predicted hydrocarbon binding protein
MRVEPYRLLKYSLREELERRWGAQEADNVLRAAGHLAGLQFHDHVVGKQASLAAMISSLQTRLREMGIGVLRVEESAPDLRHLVLTLSEDLECSGLPITDGEMCVYDEGFLAGVLERFTDRRYDVKEIDCWCTGDRTCRFRATRVDDDAEGGT